MFRDQLNESFLPDLMPKGCNRLLRAVVIPSIVQSIKLACNNIGVVCVAVQYFPTRAGSGEEILESLFRRRASAGLLEAAAKLIWSTLYVLNSIVSSIYDYRTSKTTSPIQPAV